MTSREQFEERYSQLMGTPVSVLISLRQGNKYEYTEGDRLAIAWDIWQASRDAFPFPPQPEELKSGLFGYRGDMSLQTPDWNNGYVQCLKDVKRAIHETIFD